MKNLAKQRCMFFDRYEIHIQAFVDFINGKWMSGHSSSSTFHDFQISSFLIIKNPGTLTFKNSENGQLRFPKLCFFDSQISTTNIFVEISREVPCFFSIFLEVFWSNEMKKYRLPGPKTLRNHEMLIFRRLMPWNLHFMSSI